MKTVNIWAAIISAILSTGLGFLWYMVLFREPYVEGLGRTKEQLSQGPDGTTASIYQLLGNIVMFYVLGWVMANTNRESVGQGLKVATLVWAGFVACVIGPMYAFEAFSFTFFLITTGYTLVSLLLGSILLAVWK